jgi:hypothetical protein
MNPVGGSDRALRADERVSWITNVSAPSPGPRSFSFS